MPKSNNIKFEEAIKKLEETVSNLESGSYSLEESIKKFEEAVHLIKICEEKLSSAKQKVRMLTESADGTVTDVPFIEEDSNET